jgi:putative nucleotidyltransferase with HDIG domain
MQIRQQIEQLTALRKIDQAITSSFNLRPTLETILSQVIVQLHVDAADVLLLDPGGRRLEYAAGRGFRTKAVEAAKVRVGEGYAGRAAQERRSIRIDRLKDQPDDPPRAALLADEDFASYFGVPLIAKGTIKGVLEIYQRVPFEPYPEWVDFLNILAGQAAIAVENASLFENLQSSARELERAYDMTIEGWSRALDLRDKETEGHTLRVTEMAARLAAAFGFDEQELTRIRWGALLHDIGKMGVPDGILLKEGELTEAEWEVMQKHPTFAYELLSPIRHLGSAIDIPYCHHEKWDGTGYPRGLRGEKIPLPARIFAIVDAYDALTSDRPYRPAWSRQKTLAHIRALSGTHFDPQVVRSFVDMLARD